MGLDIRVLFVGLHGQVNQISLLGALMFCYFLQGLGQQLLIFFVIGDDKGVVYLWVELMCQGLFEFPLFLDLLCFLHDPSGLTEGDDADEDNN